MQGIIAVVAQLVEHQLPKLRAAGSSPVYRSKKSKALIFQSALCLYLGMWYCLFLQQCVGHVESGTAAVAHGKDYGSAATHDVTTGIEVTY